MFYNAGKAYHNTRKSGGSFGEAVRNASSSLGATPGLDTVQRAAKDYQATRDLGQSHFDAAAIAAAKNAPLAGTIWEAGEAIDGERCGGADHGEQMSPQERAQAAANAVVEAVGAMFGIRGLRAAKSTPPTPKGIIPDDLMKLRKQYTDQVKQLEDMALKARATGADARSVANMVHAERRKLGIKYKNLTPDDELARITERNIEKYDDPLGPSIDWLRKQGKSWDDIIDSACSPGGKDLGY